MSAPPSGAVISACQAYRYVLWRDLAPVPGELLRGVVLWVMLNPSTADAFADDATIRKVCGFSRRWRFSQIRVVNLYALRSRDPKALLTAVDPIGPDNNKFICAEAAVANAIVLAWGGNAQPERAVYVRGLIRMNTEGQRESQAPVWHLGLTKDGQPKHPLMLGYNTIRSEAE